MKRILYRLKALKTEDGLFEITETRLLECVLEEVAKTDATFRSTSGEVFTKPCAVVAVYGPVKVGTCLIPIELLEIAQEIETV
ncbi:MAG: hypothetical protein QXT73_02300 [Candidatus Methanomethylicaceae archaeon]